MLIGDLRSRVDAIWNAFYTGGIANPLETIEQITYLLFLRRLDDEQLRREREARIDDSFVENPIFAAHENELRWSHFTKLEARQMFDCVDRKVFPWLRELGGAGTTFAVNMKDARFTIPNAGLLGRVVELIDGLEAATRVAGTDGRGYTDTKGDIYEYLLSKLSTAGRNGQFRTPRHIIQMMVELVAPGPKDVVCDPACGTAGFLVASADYLKKKHPDAWHSGAFVRHFNHEAFLGYDFDATMLRIASMNLLLHGVENPDVRYQNSLGLDAAFDADICDVILANPPFAGAVDESEIAPNLKSEVKSKKTELLFLALFLRLLKPGGRAAVIVPDGVLFGASTAHKAMRQTLVEKHKLEAIISMPSGIFKPYAGVSTAVLIWTKTGAGGTDHVWFYDMEADGFSLDDRRQETTENDIPDIIEKWKARQSDESLQEAAARTGKQFLVPKSEIAANGYDLSLNRYKKVEYETIAHRAPREIVMELRTLEAQIGQGLDELEAMLV